MVKTYSFLFIAILCEVAGTMLLPVSQNFTKIIPTVCLTIFYLVIKDNTVTIRRRDDQKQVRTDLDGLIGGLKSGSLPSMF